MKHATIALAFLTTLSAAAAAHDFNFSLGNDAYQAKNYDVAFREWKPLAEIGIAEAQFNILIDELTKANFIHYETSNFGKENFFSKNNSSYWLGKSYLGIGPSAHSFDGKRRSWNVQNNTKYIKSIAQNDLPIQRETLSVTDRYNEYVMTGLRTIWGVSFNKIDTDFGENYTKYLKMQSKKYIEQKLLYIENKVLKTTHKGKFLSDGIASDLFMINLI